MQSYFMPSYVSQIDYFARLLADVWLKSRRIKSIVVLSENCILLCYSQRSPISDNYIFYIFINIPV